MTLSIKDKCEKIASLFDSEDSDWENYSMPIKEFHGSASTFRGGKSVGTKVSYVMNMFKSSFSVVD